MAAEATERAIRLDTTKLFGVVVKRDEASAGKPVLVGATKLVLVGAVKRGR